VTAPDCLREVRGSPEYRRAGNRWTRFHVAGDLADPLLGTKFAPRTLARRYEALSTEMAELVARLDELTARANPALLRCQWGWPRCSCHLALALATTQNAWTSEAAFGFLVCHLAN